MIGVTLVCLFSVVVAAGLAVMLRAKEREVAGAIIACGGAALLTMVLLGWGAYLWVG